MFNKSRVTQCDSQSFTLAYGVINYALVSAQNVAVAVDEITFLNVGSVRILTDIVSVVSVRNKTDILRIAFVRDVNSGLCCDRTNGVFIVISERHQSAGEVFLRELIEHVALVFLSVLSSLYGVSAVLVNDVCIVARCDEFRLHNVGPVDHSLPLNMEVASDTGIRSFAVQIALDERFCYVLSKGTLAV